MPELFIGLMSGTSLDGIDCVLTDCAVTPPRLIAHTFRPFDAQLRATLLELQVPSPDELHRSQQAAVALAHAYAASIDKTLRSASIAPSAVRAIGCHGQTVRHRPADSYSLQLVNGAALAELTTITTVCDFRNRDIAAGGEGAPLVPAFHARVFQTPHEPRVIINLGGIANLTALATDGTVTGFDSGPGNLLMDAWIGRHRGVPYDENGGWAASGRIIPALLARLRAHPYFALAAPKSTGREQFNPSWLDALLSEDDDPGDVQATLLELTAGTVADAVILCAPAASRIFLCGGGAHNLALKRRLAGLLAPRPVADTSALGIPPERVEAMAFAWLASCTLAGQSASLPQVTGARGARILGAIYPA